MSSPVSPSPEQAAVIGAPLGPAVVVAGAGSGKTETMANRVVGLIASGAARPAEILGLTFTRKAAGELGDRIRRKIREDLGGSALDGEPSVATYDAFAARIVTEHAMRLGHEPRVEVLRAAASYALAAAVVDRFDRLVVPELSGWPSRGTLVGAVCQLHERLAVHGRTPEELRDFSAGQLADLLSIGVSTRTRKQLAEITDLVGRERVRPVVAEMVVRYREILASRGLMDFASVAALAARLAGLPAVQEVERGAARVVLLDEFQDTNPVQLELLAGLFAGCAVTAVGDPNQAIFAWRGAGSDTMGEFRDRFGRDRCLELHLSTSYRNPAPVLVAANTLAAPLRAGSSRIVVEDLRPGPGDGSAVAPVLVSRYSTEPREARAVAAAAAAALATGRTVAVLVRTRRQIPLLLTTMRAAGVAVAVVGLSGLLGVPAVIDVVSVLEVLADADRGDALMRILTGSRWRIGPHDLRTLRRLARQLGGGRDARAATAGAPEPGIVDALDLLADRPDTGGAGFSPVGLDRLRRLARELRALRTRADQPLPDLVVDVIRTTGIDVELAAAGTATAGMQADLDSFVGEADAFAAAAGSVAFAAGGTGGAGARSGAGAPSQLLETARSAVSLAGFLAFLDLAADAERGLERDESALDLGEVPGAPAVDLLTVHAAKGLEWDAVFVPGMSADVFPTKCRKSRGWLTDIGELPGPLRRDRAGQPELTALAGATAAAAKQAVADFSQQAREVHLAEERRLAYVALTRARRSLWCSSYAWSPALASARGHSVFLDEIRALATPSSDAPVAVGAWEPDGPSPWETGDPDFVEPPADWPYDPLGGHRRPAVEAGAELVRAARRRLAARPPGDVGALPEVSTLPDVGAPPDALLAGWTADVAAVCTAGEQWASAGRELTVELPAALTVTDLVALARDPDAVASRLRRPMPSPPRPAADLGTAFHEWLERRWRQEELIDLDDVPGASDEELEIVDEAALARLQQTFARSEWSARTPQFLEYPFLMPLGPVVVRGRIDAVFTDDPSGTVDIVDWKTGRPPRGAADLAAVAVQLAAYRLAWHRMQAVPLDRIRAAFHYVAAGHTVRPADLLDADGLAALLSAAAP